MEMHLVCHRSTVETCPGYTIRTDKGKDDSRRVENREPLIGERRDKIADNGDAEEDQPILPRCGIPDPLAVLVFEDGNASDQQECRSVIDGECNDWAKRVNTYVIVLLPMDCNLLMFPRVYDQPLGAHRCQLAFVPVARRSCSKPDTYLIHAMTVRTLVGDTMYV